MFIYLTDARAFSAYFGSGVVVGAGDKRQQRFSPYLQGDNIWGWKRGKGSKKFISASLVLSYHMAKA